MFGNKKEKEKTAQDPLSNDPFSELRYDAEKKQFYQRRKQQDEDAEEDEEIQEYIDKSKPAKKRDLENLLLKADERNISECTVINGYGSLMAVLNIFYYI